ncbi:MAG: adaptor protein MecA [Oscillospiraceae bacterium]|nr:adaptor protein MecA [Oscillospiraceae bacterium]
MEIRRISSRAISIYLNAADLEELDITYDSLDMICPHTRNVIRQLLECALAQTGFDPGEQHLLIEAYPLEDGCLLLFTLKEKENRVAPAGPTLILFSSFDRLCQACHQLEEAPPSALYWQDDHYILALWSSKDFEPLYSFGYPAADSELLLAELQEKDCLLLKEQAVAQLQQWF